MESAIVAIEAAIGEVTRGRGSVSKKHSLQVSSADERDQLKSVAFAWFETHRPFVVGHATHPELSAVDSAYHTVLDSTERHAARRTYSTALLKAKNALAQVRKLLLTSGLPLASSKIKSKTASTTDVAPHFGQLAADAKMQTILARRWDEVQKCIASKANLAATVMMGGLLESLLLARINGSANKTGILKSKAAPRDRAGKTLALNDWKLVNMVEVAQELRWITKSAKDVGNVLRDFRNYIHPHKEYTDGVLISDEDSRMFWEVTKSVTRQVLSSVGQSP